MSNKLHLIDFSNLVSQLNQTLGTTTNGKNLWLAFLWFKCTMSNWRNVTKSKCHEVEMSKVGNAECSQLQLALCLFDISAFEISTFDYLTFWSFRHFSLFVISQFEIVSPNQSFTSFFNSRSMGFEISATATAFAALWYSDMTTMHLEGLTQFWTHLHNKLISNRLMELLLIKTSSKIAELLIIS